MFYHVEQETKYWERVNGNLVFNKFLSTIGKTNETCSSLILKLFNTQQLMQQCYAWCFLRRNIKHAQYYAQTK